LSIYSEGAAYCEPYELYFTRTRGARTIYAFSRRVDHDPRTGRSCGQTRTTHISLDAGRMHLTISKNRDGTLRLVFTPFAKGVEPLHQP
jgi:hypothetical protein